MKITSTTSNIVTIRPGDPRFTITDGFVECKRAGFEISQNCPAEYKSIFITAINAGWLKPVAHVYGKELTMDALR
jgi:uncharacterized protein YodC (DUF2158 family)